MPRLSAHLPGAQTRLLQSRADHDEGAEERQVLPDLFGKLCDQEADHGSGDRVECVVCDRGDVRLCVVDLRNNYSQTPSNINKTQPFSQAYINQYAAVNADPSLPKVQTINGQYVYYGNTDWYKILYKPHTDAIDQNLTLSGGSEKATYYIAGRYYGQDGLFRYNSDNYHLYTLTAKGSVDVLPWLTVNDNLQFASRYYHNPENVGEGGDIWRNMADEAHPSSMLLNPDGSLTYSAAYTVGDFYYGKNGLDLNDNAIRNTAAFTAKFLRNRKLQIKGDFTFEITDSNVKETQVPVPYSPGPGITDYASRQQHE